MESGRYLPSVPTAVTQHKGGHGLVGTADLHLQHTQVDQSAVGVHAGVPQAPHVLIQRCCAFRLWTFASWTNSEVMNLTGHMTLNPTRPLPHSDGSKHNTYTGDTQQERQGDRSTRDRRGTRSRLEGWTEKRRDDTHTHSSQTHTQVTYTHKHTEDTLIHRKYTCRKHMGHTKRTNAWDTHTQPHTPVCMSSSSRDSCCR